MIERTTLEFYGIPAFSINRPATRLYIRGAVRMAAGPADQKDGTSVRTPDGPGAPERAEERMIKGYTAKRNAAMAAKSRTTTAKAKRGRPKKEAAPLPPPNPVPAQPQGFPLLIPEQLRTCLMSKDDVEAAVRKVLTEVQDKFDQINGQRKVYLSEAMERLHVKSRSTMWHWHERGYLIQEHDENGHVFYFDFKIRRAERGEHPEKGGEEDGQ